ncbi:MAG TPA: thymidylate kinase, partial [Candidatus Sumerlaeota bacterium]|nr:thymidylate kinase [Candidatus Sumerlaeota bacterium]
SGMDIGYSSDMFRSFFSYQHQIQKQFKKMQDEYGFQIINGNRSMKTIFNDLKTRISKLLPQ